MDYGPFEKKALIPLYFPLKIPWDGISDKGDVPTGLGARWGLTELAGQHEVGDGCLRDVMGLWVWQ